jgi:hypothetical protein
MNTPDQNEINIGIDTSQSMLDIYVRPQGIFQPFENNPEGIRSTIRFIKQFKPTPVLIEATGRLEMAFFCAAHKAGLPVCVCNPIQVRPGHTEHSLECLATSCFGLVPKPIGENRAFRRESSHRLPALPLSHKRGARPPDPERLTRVTCTE